MEVAVTAKKLHATALKRNTDAKMNQELAVLHVTVKLSIE